MNHKTWLVTLTFFISLFIFSKTYVGNTAFNHFTLLADAFLNGRIYIEGEMPWLEKIPVDEKRFYVANPPMPAVISILPVYFFGKDLPQPYISMVLGALLVTITFSVSLKVKNSIKLAIWSAILIGFGTINWYLITVGATWYFAHVTSQLFLVLAIYSLLKNKHPSLIGLLLGFAYFSRIPTILLIPFFLMNLPKPFWKNAVLLFLGIAPSIFANFLYNYVRFGVVWDIGYTMIPGISSEPWYEKGLVHPDYIKEHLKLIFLALPHFSELINLSKPSVFGYAIWFTTPAFIFAFFNKVKERAVWSGWIAILLVSLLIFSHGSTGFTQFGYRFASDFYPVLVFLTIKGVANLDGPKWYHWLILSLCVAVNAWGVLYS